LASVLVLQLRVLTDIGWLPTDRPMVEPKLKLPAPSPSKIRR
jgi:hypothetical protein